MSSIKKPDYDKYQMAWAFMLVGIMLISGIYLFTSLGSSRDCYKFQTLPASIELYTDAHCTNVAADAEPTEDALWIYEGETCTPVTQELGARLGYRIAATAHYNHCHLLGDCTDCTAGCSLCWFSTLLGPFCYAACMTACCTGPACNPPSKETC